MNMERVSDFIAHLSSNELWRPIDGWPGYSVSSFGRVTGKRSVLKPSLVQGYEVVTLTRSGTAQNARVHRLAALAFLGEPTFPGAIVAHNDGDKTNNRLNNLRWASARENQFDRARHKTHCRGSRVFGAKLQEAQIPSIRQRIAAGERYSDIAQDFGVSKSAICMIKKNLTWRSAGGAAWEIKNVG